MPAVPLPGWMRLPCLGLLVALLPACVAGVPQADGPGRGIAVSVSDPGASSEIVRLHTRLLVAGLSCEAEWRDPGAFERYTAFVARNGDLIRGAQRVVETQLGSRAHLDTEQTGLFNRETLRMRRMGRRAYCAEMRAPFYRTTGRAGEEIAGLP